MNINESCMLPDLGLTEVDSVDWAVAGAVRVYRIKPIKKTYRHEVIKGAMLILIILTNPEYFCSQIAFCESVVGNLAAIQATL